MESFEDNLTEIKKYFKKLFYIVENESNVPFSSKKMVNKKRVDDILCCIEGSLPNGYIYYRESGVHDVRNLKSYTYYDTMLLVIKHTSFLFSNKYIIDIIRLKGLASSFIEALKSDIKIIQENI